jgi:putative PIN family toxin of toxin-antitoxin system
MTRIVLDTNAVVSALLQTLGPSAQLLALGLRRSVQLCVSGAVYAEYEEVISRPRFRRDPDVIANTLRAIRENSLWVRPAITVRACADPDDNMLLECAQAARAHSASSVRRR